SRWQIDDHRANPTKHRCPALKARQRQREPNWNFRITWTSSFRPVASALVSTRCTTFTLDTASRRSAAKAGTMPMDRSFGGAFLLRPVPPRLAASSGSRDRYAHGPPADITASADTAFCASQLAFVYAQRISGKT